jgi:Protein of unknown function (DUF2796)
MRTKFAFTSGLAFAGLAAVALVVTLPGGARAEEEHRELGPHVHGHGTLNIAVENKRVSMDLEVPGMDIVGFEHAASTDEQKKIVETATAQLNKPLEVFKLSQAAGCTVADAKVAIEPEHHHDGDDDDHDADHDKAAGGHDEHAGHNEFHVTYALDCSEPASLTAITFDYFKMFAGAHDLTVNVVTAKAQNSYEVNRDKPELDLAGVM